VQLDFANEVLLQISFSISCTEKHQYQNSGFANYNSVSLSSYFNWFTHVMWVSNKRCYWARL